MNTIFVIAFATLLWFCALLQGTGIGSAIDITEKAQVLLIGISLLLIIHKQSSWVVKSKPFRIWIGTILIFVVLPYFIEHQSSGMDYLMVFLVVFILSQFSITERCVKWIAWIYGLLGFLFLFVYNKTSILSGWNENSIAMIAFFSYSIWVIGAMSNLKRWQVWKKVIGVFGASIYLYLLEDTGARSSILFVVIGLLLVLDVIKLRKVFADNRYKILLYLPLVIAVLCIVISKLPMYEYLEIWSYREFRKPIFNGRESIWENGFEILFKNLFLGTGKLGNHWHNSAITCLTAYGVIGYVLWINLFNDIIIKGKKFIQDRYIYGSLVAFFLIYVQQSVELGLIATNPNFIPYVALGILLGRVRYIEQHDMSRDVHHLKRREGE